MVDQDSPHSAGRDGEKVKPVLPLDGPISKQTEERLVNQRGGLQRVIAPLKSERPTSDFLQSRIHDFQQDPLRLTIAGRGLTEKYRDIKWLVGRMHSEALANKTLILPFAQFGYIDLISTVHEIDPTQRRCVYPSSPLRPHVPQPL
jgi:hypothetical protein